MLLSFSLRSRVVRSLKSQLALLAGAGLCFASTAVWGQSVTFAGASSTVAAGVTGEGTWLYVAPEVAADASGNVYLPDPNTGSVYKETPSPTGYIQSTVASGFKRPTYVGVDNSGNVYVADLAGGTPTLYKATLSGGSYTKSTVAVFEHDPYAIAVDGSGDVYVNTAATLFKETLTGGIYAQSTPSYTIYGGGLAVDGSGNLYSSDFNTHAVYKSELNGPTTIVSTNFRYPRGVAVDASGNVYVSDIDGFTVYKESLSEGTYTQTPIISAITNPDGLALDRSGNVYVATGGGEFPVLKVQPGPVNFGSASVCPAGQTTPAPCSRTLSLGYIVEPTTTELGSARILSQGAEGLDFQAQSGAPTQVSCVTYGTAIVFTSCTVDVTFAPLAPGARYGAVQLLDANGDVLNTTYIYGTGDGAQIAFSPSPQVNFGSDYIGVNGLTVDSSGNIFLADGLSLKEIVAAGGYATTKTLATFPNAPISVAVDGAGNLFAIAGGSVNEVLAAGGYTTVKSLGSGFNQPLGAVVDGSGNVFVADYLNSVVKEILAAGGYTTIKTLASVPNMYPTAIALDANDNVFVISGSDVEEIPAAGGYTTISTVATSPTLYQTTLAVDASGNLFTTNGSVVYEFMAAGGYTTVNTIGDTINVGFTGVYKLALDGTGNVFIENSILHGDDPDTQTITEIERSAPPQLLITTKAPQSMLIQNVGNEPLSGTGVLSDTTNFDVTVGSGSPQDCTLGLSLAAGAGCNLSIALTPQNVKPIYATLVLSDNSAANGSQTINLYGNTPFANTPIAGSSSVLNFGTVEFPGTEAKSLTVTNLGQGSMNVTPSINGPSYVVTNNSCMGIVAGHSCILQILFNPLDPGTHDDVLTLKTNLGGKTSTVQLEGSAQGVGIASATESSLQFGTIMPGSTEILPLTIAAYGVTGSQSLGFSINSPSYKLLPGSSCATVGVSNASKSCTVQIEFAPTIAGVQNGTLTIKPSVSASSTVSLLGSAGVIAPTTSGPMYFANTAVGASQTLSLVVKNNGVSGSPKLAASTNGPSYKVLPGSTCMSTGIANGQSCTLQVEFAPVSAELHSDILTVTPSSGGSPFPVQLIGTGVAH